MSFLEFLYETKPGRLLLKFLVSRPVSVLAGAFLDSRFSKPLIGPFVRRNGIRTEDYLLDDIHCFNDFFCRRIHPELRPIDLSPDRLVAPCDGLMSVYPIQRDQILPVKQSCYRVTDLLQDQKLAKRFEGGYCFVFRLCVDHYHRYIYPVSGRQDPVIRIHGRYHTVRPVALRNRPVFCENTREYTLLHAEKGAVLQMEVGALLVGRICNHLQGDADVVKGTEKGMFEYGGSTIVLLTEPGCCKPLKVSSSSAEEIPVRMGEPVAVFV